MKEFKIKVLPKKGADPQPQEPRKKRKKNSKPSKSSGPAFLLLVVAVGVAGYLIFSKPSSSSKFTGTAATDNINRYLQDGQKKTEFNELEVSLENKALPQDEVPAFLPLETEETSRRPMGVELDQDPAMDNVYKDLYGETRGPNVQTPEERINARLAEKKWVNRFEREEKKTFIRNFIAAAREAGYEIELNDDLIVTRVRPITNRPKISLEKVIERMNSQ